MSASTAPPRKTMCFLLGGSSIRILNFCKDDDDYFTVTLTENLTKQLSKSSPILTRSTVSNKENHKEFIPISKILEPNTTSASSSEAATTLSVYS